MTREDVEAWLQDLFRDDPERMQRVREWLQDLFLDHGWKNDQEDPEKLSETI